MNRVVGAIWSGMLIVTVVAVVPAVVNLLRRALAAAGNIERYSAEILAGAWASPATRRASRRSRRPSRRRRGAVAGAGSIERHAAAINRPRGRRRDGGGGQP